MQVPNVRPTIPLNRFLSDAQIVEALSASRRQLSRRDRAGTAQRLSGAALALPAPLPTSPRSRSRTRSRLTSTTSPELVGWESVAIGSDVDTAHERGETPSGLDSVADWREVAAAAPTMQREALLGLNWLRFLGEVLP